MRRLLLLLLVILSGACNSAPTTPERHGIPQIVVACDSPTTVSLTSCRATVYCSLYSCEPTIPHDVTTAAEWTSDAPGIVRIASPGLLEAVSPGNTVVRAKWTYAGGPTSSFVSVAVFVGTAPLQTYEYEGNVYDGGGPPRTPLNGALVEIVTGLVAGRQTVSGNPPDFLPGATILPPVPGHYGFFGVPQGTYRLRVSKSGFLTQELETKQMADVTLLPQR